MQWLEIAEHTETKKSCCIIHYDTSTQYFIKYNASDAAVKCEISLLKIFNNSSENYARINAFLSDYYNFPKPNYKFPYVGGEPFKPCEKYYVFQEDTERYLFDNTQSIAYQISSNDTRQICYLNTVNCIIIHEYGKYFAVKITKDDNMYITVVNCEKNFEYFIQYVNGECIHAILYKFYSCYIAKNTEKYISIGSNLYPILVKSHSKMSGAWLVEMALTNIEISVRTNSGKKLLFKSLDPIITSMIKNLEEYVFDEMDNDEKQISKIPDDLLCVVCKTGRRQYAFASAGSCGHFIYCAACAWHESLRKKCAVCNRVYDCEALVKIFV